MSNFDLKDPKGRPASVSNFSPYDAYRHEATVIVSEFSVARISAANDAIRSIVTILQQREVDMETDSGNRVLSSSTAMGLLNAVACCADFAEMHAIGSCTTFTNRFSGDGVNHPAVMLAAVAAAEKFTAQK